MQYVAVKLPEDLSAPIGTDDISGYEEWMNELSEELTERCEEVTAAQGLRFVYYMGVPTSVALLIEQERAVASSLLYVLEREGYITRADKSVRQEDAEPAEKATPPQSVIPFPGEAS